MEHFIKYVDIHNFKSIRDLKLEDCRRINLFIGYPNVGKSNVLEALSLFSVPFLHLEDNINKLIRIENKNELFYNVENILQSVVETNLDRMVIESKNNGLTITPNKVGVFYYFFKNLALYAIGNNEPTGNIDINSNIKRYTFQTNNKWQSNGDSQLLPPFGENIIDVFSYNDSMSEVKAWMKEKFNKFGLEYVLDKSSNSLKVQKRLGNDEVFILPYSSIADTLQRIIFYKTAIASNKNSVLLFEEPEAHAFPPYIRTFTQDVIDAESNQFFIVTHSPYIITEFLKKEDLRKDVAVYIFDYQDNQTVAKRLTDEEIDEVYNYDVDLFFNIERFLRDE